MKALPDVATRAEHDVVVDCLDGAIRDERGAAVEYEDGADVIDCVYSPARSEETEERLLVHECDNEYRRDDGDAEDPDSDRRRKSKKKHKKHHHNKREETPRARKKHKKRKNRVDPIFLWAQKKETKIVRVVCEDYDRHNRIRLVRTSSGLWSSNPRSKVLAAAKSRSASVYDYEESQKGTTDSEGSDAEKQPDDKLKNGVEQNVGLVDLNDNSIEAVCGDGEENDIEQRAWTDRTLEMIDQEPALSDDSKISLPNGETTCIKLPEGTTIHQVQFKAENTTIDIGNNTCTTSPPLPPPPPSQPLSPAHTPMHFGELTIIPQQQQHEPLNLENTVKRCSLEIRLQEPPLKKKRTVESVTLPNRPQHQPVNQPSPIDIPVTVGKSVHVKYETDALSELKEVLSDPTLSVPDPLLVPRARLAALVASPATEIPKLLVHNTPPSLLPLPPTTDPDLLAVSLSHLRSMLQQQSPTNIDPMLWLSYDLSSKDMAGVNDDILSGVLNFLLPSCNSTAAQQPFNYPQPKQQQPQQQQQQWSDPYYSGSQLAMPYGSNSTPGYGKSDDCCSSLSPLQKLLQSTPPISQVRKSQKSRLPLISPAKQRICRDMCCSSTSPSSCYESCCSKVSVCNPFTVSPPGYNPYAVSPTSCNPFSVSPNGFNPFVVSPTVCASNLKTACNTYPMTEGATTAYCFSQDIGCGGYNGLSSPRSLQQKLSSVSPSNGVQYSANQTGLAKQQQQSPQLTESGDGGGGVGGAASYGTGGDHQRFADTSDKPQTPPARASVALPNVAVDTVPPTEPVRKPKIKVKKHLVDPNAKPQLLNIEGALHLAGANPQDLFSSPLWHPLFGSQEKRYGCRWQWTTPVTEPEPKSSDKAGGNVD